MVTIVSCGTDVDIGDVFAPQKCPRPRDDLAGGRYRTRAVDNTVIVAISAHDIVGAVQHRRKDICQWITIAGFGMQEDRPRLGVGLQRGKRPVGEYEHGFTRADLVEAVATRHAAGRHGCFRSIAIGIGGARAEILGVLSRHCGENDIGHGGLFWLGSALLLCSYGPETRCYPPDS
ncbi:hypothetical protein AGR2A_Cc100297 [Agrobacterium genomosp. 2 str. CFBP 5494]|uniref:Uncharacterized protein n=1 Tax=Agrobacterium genomosp. 2 str. CFBP 5494 TaxID=1183436 RepID=A0A9W5AXR1_9HYPH|nr:hypothetical protein AGR2A_Cc100297 [Agrobacterium genomosp. 2 str. CFBP 5494]